MDDSKGERGPCETLSLRVERRTLQLIDRAVAEVGGDLSRFIAEAAYRRAEDILLDRCLFRADEEAIEALDRALEPAAEGNKALGAMVRRERYWSG